MAKKREKGNNKEGNGNRKTATENFINEDEDEEKELAGTSDQVAGLF